DAAWSPTWSPDNQRIVFSGSVGGITDLFVVNADGSDLKQLTHDKFGDLQPQWSPDGKTIVFASERGGASDLSVLKFKSWNLNLLDIATGQITEIPGTVGLALNPQWAPDSRSIAYINDRTGIPNVFLYDLD